MLFSHMVVLREQSGKAQMKLWDAEVLESGTGAARWVSFLLVLGLLGTIWGAR